MDGILVANNLAVTQQRPALETTISQVIYKGEYVHFIDYDYGQSYLTANLSQLESNGNWM